MSKPTGMLAPHDARQWTRRDATHLLWRAQFGASVSEIDSAHKESLSKNLDRLLTPQPESEEFQVVEPLLRETAYDTGSISDLQAWWLYRMHYSANPLTEKLALFWHNHFATSSAKVRSVPHMAAQNDLFRSESLGSFRKMLHGMAKDVAMLIWLDGNANRKRQANENFAREVLELFSLGEGNYSENDIKQAARAFTGWHVRADKFWFNERQHDYGSKTVFGRTGKFDGGDIIDLSLEQKACPRFIAFKLLRTFVLDQPTEAHITALAARIQEHDFAMRPVMRELFSSRLFFSAKARHAIIKSPLELVLGACRALEVRANLKEVNRVSGQLGQSIFEPPTVKGWEGGRLWINSASLLQRNNFAMALLEGKMGSMAKLGKNVTHYRELLLAREVSGLKEFEGEPQRLVHLMMTLPEFQLI
ncbi:MAG: DUF1800 domain-containing protein [Pedosphaera sp.]|nr:DUF1800 domain-containing protein [Pedosphaera sp.]